MTGSNGDTARVSVVIPSYNHGQFLVQCLDSVIQQTVPPFEILIGEGGSKDNSQRILDDYSQKHPGFVKIHRLPGLSINQTIDYLIHLSQGNLVAFLGADDYWNPRFIEEMSKAIKQGVCVAYCDLYLAWPRRTIPWLVPDYDLSVLRRTNYISLNGAIMKKECLEAIYKRDGMIFDDRVGIPTDWDLWLRMSPRCKFVHVPRLLAYFRRHRNQNSSRFRLEYDLYRVYSRYNSVGLRGALIFLVFGRVISFLRRYEVHPIADFLLIPVNKGSSSRTPPLYAILGERHAR